MTVATGGWLPGSGAIRQEAAQKEQWRLAAKVHNLCPFLILLTNQRQKH